MGGIIHSVPMLGSTTRLCPQSGTGRFSFSCAKAARATENFVFLFWLVAFYPLAPSAKPPGESKQGPRFIPVLSESQLGALSVFPVILYLLSHWSC